MKRLTIALLTTGLICWAALLTAQTFGNENIEIFGGKRGNITLPHHMHQEMLDNCTQCHKFFPKEPGGIAKMVEAKSIKKKTVMNKACISCHKENKKAGNDYGPVSCKGCHIK